MRKERWRPIKGFEGYYAISDHGRVKSLARTQPRDLPYGNGELCVQERILKPIGGRYHAVRLYIGHGQYTSRGISKLVAEHFLKKKDPNHDVVRHNDDNTHNNHYKNLKWGTQADNMRDRCLRGRTPKGEAHCKAVLSEIDIRKIKRLLLKHTTREVASMYSISPSHVSRIGTGKKWAHIK